MDQTKNPMQELKSLQETMKRLGGEQVDLLMEGLLTAQRHVDDISRMPEAHTPLMLTTAKRVLGDLKGIIQMVDKARPASKLAMPKAVPAPAPTEDQGRTWTPVGEYDQLPALFKLRTLGPKDSDWTELPLTYRREPNSISASNLRLSRDWFYETIKDNTLIEYAAVDGPPVPAPDEGEPWASTPTPVLEEPPAMTFGRTGPWCPLDREGTGLAPGDVVEVRSRPQISEHDIGGNGWSHLGSYIMKTDRILHKYSGRAAYLLVELAGITPESAEYQYRKIAFQSEAVPVSAHQAASQNYVNAVKGARAKGFKLFRPEKTERGKVYTFTRIRTNLEESTASPTYPEVYFEGTDTYPVQWWLMDVLTGDVLLKDTNWSGPEVDEWYYRDNVPTCVWNPLEPETLRDGDRVTIRYGYLPKGSCTYKADIDGGWSIWKDGSEQVPLLDSRRWGSLTKVQKVAWTFKYETALAEADEATRPA